MPDAPAGSLDPARRPAGGRESARRPDPSRSGVIHFLTYWPPLWLTVSGGARARISPTGVTLTSRSAG